jgi:tetratricopeptide (TPR) repeat protein
VAAYVELAFENRRAALEIDDTALQANALFYLVDALGHAGRLAEARELAEDALARIPRRLSVTDQAAGLNPYSVFIGWRGHCLYWSGQIPDGIEELGRALKAAEEDDTPMGAVWALTGVAEACCLSRDATPALASARQLEEITRRVGDPPIMVALTQLCYGYAHLATGRTAEATEAARIALDIFSRGEREFMGVAATLLAEALLAAGDFETAETAAKEAIMLSHGSLKGIYEAISQGVLARALLRRDGPAARDAAATAIGIASQLIDRTGARALAPALCEWRAELFAAVDDEVASEQLLRQAEQGYAQIGAPKQAQRLATQRQTRLG